VPDGIYSTPLTNSLIQQYKSNVAFKAEQDDFEVLFTDKQRRQM